MKQKGSVNSPKMDKADILIYDIETATAGIKPDAKKDRLKIFGYYSYKTGHTGLIPFTDKAAIQKTIDAHKFLIGFNNEVYDDPILKREGIKLDYKRIIDLRKIFKLRAGSMITNKGMLGLMLMEYSLDYITRFLDIVTDEDAKDSIDYDIFKKDVWTAEDKAKIKFYTERDIEITKKLYEWVEKYFEGFKDFLPKHDVENKYHLTDTGAKFAYKAICHALGWEPIYDSESFQNPSGESISGGYVAYPAGEKFIGNIYCLDFNSLYPSIMMQCNLYGRNKDNTGWHGGEHFDVEGYYDDKKLSPVGELLKAWYYLRLFYKRKLVFEDGKTIQMHNKKTGESVRDYIGKKFYKVMHTNGKTFLELTTMTEDLAEEYIELAKSVDKKEYTVKIIINTIYGILNNAYYKLVYDLVAGGDCTRLGRQWTKFARRYFKSKGYKILYTDTDSWYVIDVFNDLQKLLKTKDEVINYIKSSVPFPLDVFDAGIDAEITAMFFFKGAKTSDKESDKEMDEDDIINKPKGFMKKNYIYVEKNGKLTIKNLGIKKKNISALSKEIFWDYIVPKIKSDNIVKFSKTELENLMRSKLQQNIKLAYMRKNVNDVSAYRKSPTGIQAQIARKYGPGIHFLIPNIRNIGVGKGVKVCSVQEFEQYKMDVSDIDFTNFWKELNYFVKEQAAPSLIDWGI